MKFYFSPHTSSWILGKAIARLNPRAHYDERNNPIGQVITAERIEVDLDNLNRVIERTPLIGGSGGDFTLDIEGFSKIKDYLRERGRVVHETDKHIIVEEAES